jgi:hypothetical protein
VKDAADETDEGGGGPAGVVEGWSTLRLNGVDAFLELLSGVAGEDPNSDQLKDITATGEHGFFGIRPVGCVTRRCVVGTLTAVPKNQRKQVPIGGTCTCTCAGPGRADAVDWLCVFRVL